jgi:hypothetical protein
MEQLERFFEKDMTVTFAVEIEDCSACPCMKAERHYTADSFEMVFDWVCTKNFRAIVATMEWNDQKPAIPAWCPLRSNVELNGVPLAARPSDRRERF